MRREEGPSPPAQDPPSLEERLRRLPAPPVPPHLRERILSSAPRFRPERARARPAPDRARAARRWSLGAAAAAAALAAVLLSVDPAARRPVIREAAKAAAPPGVLYAASTDPKETDPCCVLPPMPEWRS